jgi:hypothetical protein
VPKPIRIDTLRREVEELHEAYPKWTLDNAFVHWFVQAFLVADRDAAAHCVTGVSHDKGVDGIYIDESASKVFVLQGKFHLGAKPPLEPRSHVIAFSQLARTLTGGDQQYRSYRERIDPVVGQRLDEARSRLRRRNFALHLYYVTTGKCSGPLKAEAEAEVSQVTGIASVSILDRNEILALLIDYLGGAAPPVPYLDLRIDSRGIVGSDGVIQRYDPGSGIESWILTMSGREVAALYERAGDRLFARNIRGFLGDTAINEGMQDTLKHEAEHFWYFNNGITIVCDTARKTAERGEAILRVTNPQVINGQQTTRMLHVVASRHASVLIRVISVARTPERGSAEFEKLVSNIVQATNWQNHILASDLRANDERQVALQRDLAKWRYHYMRKRQTKKEARRLLGNQHWFWIKKDELAQVVGACECDPFLVRSGKEGLFKPPYYDRIFDGRAVREYLAMYWLGRVVKYHGKGHPDRAYAKWLVLNFLWSKIGPLLRPKIAADHFRSICEHNRWSPALDEAAKLVYASVMSFFRDKRGKGTQALDVSTFFYRPHLHTRFPSYWNRSKNRHRARFQKKVKQFAGALLSAASH